MDKIRSWQIQWIIVERRKFYGNLNNIQTDQTFTIHRASSITTATLIIGTPSSSDCSRSVKFPSHIYDLCSHVLISRAITDKQLAKDLELFAHHAGRKSVNMEDVILTETCRH
ncbi:uncharacterized protein LOC124916194 [Impatiens glandulifera]|uniref:uncharacterized protein LOC124916194 n=1 Tax=Impatiens glandulifera TaxID=253017 RepID=UPI001FB14391|nr:uncharacterized protein LOC124916194 [Impatiens glandulifera]